MIIETERLILRRWQESDATAYFAINNDVKVTEFLRGSLSKKEVTDFIGGANIHQDQHGYTLWAAELKNTQELIGFIGLNYIDWSDIILENNPHHKNSSPFLKPVVEIGWRLGSQYWNKGYATEGAIASLNYGINKIGLKEILSWTVPANKRSFHVMEKIGMKRDYTYDFHHPKLTLNHPLSQHILYKFPFV